jgi:hypothetical protein
LFHLGRYRSQLRLGLLVDPLLGEATVIATFGVTVLRERMVHGTRPGRAPDLHHRHVVPLASFLPEAVVRDHALGEHHMRMLITPVALPARSMHQEIGDHPVRHDFCADNRHLVTASPPFCARCGWPGGGTGAAFLLGFERRDAGRRAGGARPAAGARARMVPLLNRYMPKSNSTELAPPPL